MRNRLARWDATPDEKATLPFARLIALVNVRRVELGALLGLFTRGVEWLGGLRNPTMYVEFPLLIGFLLTTRRVARLRDVRLQNLFIAAFLLSGALTAQANVVAFGIKGRLTSVYPFMVLTLSLLFVLRPRIVIPGVIALFVSYAAIVLAMPVRAGEKFIALENTAIVSVIAVVATALIHAGRRRDHDQQQQIRRQNDLLRHRNAELDTLMAITAHDLRSPLYGLRNLFELTTRRAAADPALPLRVVGQATASVEAMLALTTRLLDAHAAEHRRLGQLTDEDVRGHVLAAAERIAPLATTAAVTVALDLPARPLIARIEPGALAQILDNLLSNAIRFSARGDVVELAAHGDGAGVTVVVRDRGAGVADPARLFTKFHRGGPTRADALPGTGMGLFIVATLATRIAATVRHHPTDGGGATFTLALPTPDLP